MLIIDFSLFLSVISQKYYQLAVLSKNIPYSLQQPDYPSLRPVIDDNFMLLLLSVSIFSLI